jgi:hypothetical protein
MSVIKVNNITNRDGTSGPVIAGIATVSSTSHLVVPTGNTGQKVALAPDPFINNLVLALPFNSESVFTDVSPRGNQPMPTGIGTTTASLPFGVSGVTSTSSGIQTSISKYYGSSAYFDGSGDYLSASGSSDLSLSGDFTIEVWVNPFSASSGVSIFCLGNSSASSGLLLYYSTGVSKWAVYSGGVRNIEGSSGYSGIYKHIAVVRNSGVVNLYIDGVVVGSNWNTYQEFSGTLYIGAESNPTIFPTSALYLQDLRIYKGVAKYTSNFTPPNQIAL